MRHARRWTAAVGTAALLGLVAGCDPAPMPWISAPATLDAAGTATANGDAFDVVLSPDGTKIAFVTTASDLGPVDTNGVDDVYIRDLATGATTLVSVNGAGTDAAGAASGAPVLSADGTKVVFITAAGDLGPTDTNGVDDVYVRDLAAGTTKLASVNETGTDGGNAEVRGLRWVGAKPSISPDGTRVAFASFATDLGPADSDGWSDLYVRDLVAGSTVKLSNDGGQGVPGAGHAMAPVFSPDGSTVAFNAWTGPFGSYWSKRLFLADLPTGELREIGWAALDPVSFDATGTELVYAEQDPDGLGNVMIVDVASGAAERITVPSPNPDDSVDGEAGSPSFSPDGTAVVFSSRASNLGPVDTNGAPDVYLHDRPSGTTTLVSANIAGTDAGNGSSAWPSFTADGTAIVFTSGADDLGPVDTNGNEDVYVADVDSGVISLVSTNASGDDAGDGWSGGALAAPDGTIVYLSEAADLDAADANGRLDIFVARVRQADLETTLTAPPDAVAGREVGYTVDVVNHGPDVAADVTVDLLLPEGTAAVAADSTLGACTLPPAGPAPVVSCSVGDLAAGDEETVTVTATVPADLPAGARLAAVAVASSAWPDPDGAAHGVETVVG